MVSTDVVWVVKSGTAPRENGSQHLNPRMNWHATHVVAHFASVTTRSSSIVPAHSRGVETEQTSQSKRVFKSLLGRLHPPRVSRADILAMGPTRHHIERTERAINLISFPSRPVDTDIIGTRWVYLKVMPPNQAGSVGNRSDPPYTVQCPRINPSYQKTCMGLCRSTSEVTRHRQRSRCVRTPTEPKSSTSAEPGINLDAKKRCRTLYPGSRNLSGMSQKARSMVSKTPKTRRRSGSSDKYDQR